MQREFIGVEGTRRGAWGSYSASSRYFGQPEAGK